MDADGTKNGYDLPMTRAVAEAVEIPVVASGGAGQPEHLYQALTEGRPTPPWPPASSTTTSMASPRPSATWPSTACRSG